MVASQNGHVEVVDKLLQHGARVDLQIEVGFTNYGNHSLSELMFTVKVLCVRLFALLFHIYNQLLSVLG